MRKDAIICDCSSIAPDASIELNKAFAAKGAHFLDSPVTGSTGGADKATLTFMIGGDKAVFERAKPYMEIMGKLFYYCGAAGQGLKAKVTQNLVGASIMQSFAEGLILATKAGIPPELMIDILENSAAKSGIVVQSSLYPQPRFRDQLLGQVDAQGCGIRSGAGEITGLTASHSARSPIRCCRRPSPKAGGTTISAPLSVFWKIGPE